MSSRSIVELAAVIQANTAKVFEDLQSQGIALPSFDATSPPVLNLSDEATTAQKDALEALDELKVHLMGPLVHATAHVLYLLCSFQACQSSYTIIIGTSHNGPGKRSKI